jgi:hypothetical protein
MSKSRSSYCSCSTCKQIRNEQPKHYRYLYSLRNCFAFCHCLSRRRSIFEVRLSSSSSPTARTQRLTTITFRDIDITHKHCSKHDVMVKASRSHLSREQIETLRQRVNDANQRWTRMSRLPVNLIEFIFDEKDSLPLCHICYENLSMLTFNLCHVCIRNVLHTHLFNQSTAISMTTVQEEIQLLSIDTDSIVFNDNRSRNRLATHEQIFFDSTLDESII